MTDYIQLFTAAERQRLASQVQLILQQPQLSDHCDLYNIRTTLRYCPARASRQKRRRKYIAHQGSSLECQENGLGLTCELVVAKRRDKVRVRSSGERFAALVVSEGSDGSQHFCVSIVDSSSKNIDVVLGAYENEISIICIHPRAFINSLREVADAGTNARDSNVYAQTTDVAGKRRPRSRVATSVWNIRDVFTLKGVALRLLSLLAAAVGYHRMEAVWKKVNNMTHWYHGQIDPSLGSTPVVQQVFEVLKSLETLDVGVDVKYVKSSLTRALFVDTILVAAYVDVPQLVATTYVVITLVVKGGAGPFYRTFCLEAIYFMREEYNCFAGGQMLDAPFDLTSLAILSRVVLVDAARLFYICLLCWNPKDRTQRTRYLIRSLTASMLMSILFTAVAWTPLFTELMKPNNIKEYVNRKTYHLPELRPGDLRNIPFVTT